MIFFQDCSAGSLDNLSLANLTKEMKVSEKCEAEAKEAFKKNFLKSTFFVFGFPVTDNDISKGISQLGMC